jgi:outer membrane receptor protein involved in Fe transport
MRVNSDEIRSTGVEVLLSQALGPLTLEGDLTLQKVDLMDEESSLSSEPENMPERAGKVRLSFPLLAGFTGAAEADYTGPQFCQHPNTGEDVELDGGTWWNGLLSKVWALRPTSGMVQRLETQVSVTNLGNTVLYDQCGLPRAGRLFRFQVRVF